MNYELDEIFFLTIPKQAQNEEYSSGDELLKMKDEKHRSSFVFIFVFFLISSC